MKLCFYFMCLLMAVTAAALSGCGSDAENRAAVSAAEAERSVTPTNRIDIPPMVRSNLGITFAKVERRAVGATIRVPGAFELEPLARHEYRMTLPGRVELRVTQYQQVQPGDVLYRFRSPQWPELQHKIIVGEQEIESARAEIEVAEAKITEGRQRLAGLEARMGALADASLRRADLETQATELRASLPRMEAELRSAQTTLRNGERTREHALHQASAASGIPESQLSAEVEHEGRKVPAYATIDWIEVTATEPGVVELLAVTDGAFVEPPAVVVSTVDPSQVRFRAMALQADLPRLNRNLGAHIAPPTTPGLSINDTVPASVTRGLEAHPEHRTATLLATPSELRPWMRPGITAFLEVVVESTGGPALAIPRSAVVKDGITHVFFRRDPNNPNQVIRVEADLGVSDGRWVAINSGVMLGDEVVLEGAYELKLASEQSGTTQRGGHFHADGSYHSQAH
jgi:hypothetical protein